VARRPGRLSLADLLDTRVNIASKKPQTTRETPASSR
jgi:hypothetical protein